MPAALGRDLTAPGLFELPAQIIVFHVLKSGQTIGNRTHVSAALNVILSAKGIDAAAIAADMASEKCKIDERKNIIDCVVMFCNAQRPAKLRARGFGVSVGHLANGFGRNTGLALGAFQRVFLHACFVRFKATCRILDKFIVREAGGYNLAAHRIG